MYGSSSTTRREHFAELLMDDSKSAGIDKKEGQACAVTPRSLCILIAYEARFSNEGSNTASCGVMFGGTTKMRFRLRKEKFPERFLQRHNSQLFLIMTLDMSLSPLYNCGELRVNPLGHFFVGASLECGRFLPWQCTLSSVAFAGS
jgi:hypothetical protein